MRPALVLLILCLVLPGPVQATEKKAKPAAAAKAKKGGGSAPKFIKGSEEGSAERDRRLFRECKGRVNAGACAGYTGS
jgi:hypothetical protein